MNLRRQNLNFKSVIPKDTRIFLLDNSNLSTGGEAIDFTNYIHPDYITLAIKVAKDMNLRFCGLDIISKGVITKKLSGYTILEVNDSPGIDNYSSDEKEKIEIFLKILKTLMNE